MQINVAIMIDIFSCFRYTFCELYSRCMWQNGGITFMREKTVSILDRLFWTVQPPKGLIHGNYYHEEMRFAPSYEGAAGHLGAIDVVTDQGKLVMVEFHETCSPTYYTRM